MKQNVFSSDNKSYVYKGYTIYNSGYSYIVYKNGKQISEELQSDSEAEDYIDNLNNSGDNTANEKRNYVIFRISNKSNYSLYNRMYLDESKHFRYRNSASTARFTKDESSALLKKYKAKQDSYQYFTENIH